jgi:proteasome accessory factor B
VVELPDGSLEWRATVAGTIEIRLWILSWGDDVEVVAPAGLRDDVAATHARAAARYGGRGSDPGPR